MIQEKRENEFIKLRQWTSSVVDYEERFTKLSRFVPELVAIERRRIRRFIQGLNVEIQEGLAVTQISTFTEALEKAQRVESVKLQVRDFRAKKRGTPSNPSRQADKSAPPPEMGKGIGGVKASGTPRGAIPRGGHSGRGQLRGIPSSGQAVAPQIVCGYCCKSNHTKNEC